MQNKKKQNLMKANGNLFFLSLFIVLGSTSCSWYTGREDNQNSVLSDKSEDSEEREIIKVECNHTDKNWVMYNMTNMTVDDVLYYYDSLDIAGIQVMPTDFQEKYTDIAMGLYAESIKRRGYKIPSEEVFKQRLYEVFKVDLDSNVATDWFCKYVFDKADVKGRAAQRELMELKDHQYFGPFWESIVCDCWNRMVFDSPDIYGIVYVEGREIYADDESVAKKGDSVCYDLNDKAIVASLHQNNYIFHNSKSSLVWLVLNNPNYLIHLFHKYGYDTVPEINKLVIADAEETWYNFMNRNRMGVAYRDLFARHNSKGELQIREGFLKYIKDYYMECDDNEMLRFNEIFSEYKNGLVQSLRDEIPDYLSGYTEEERMKLAAYVGYYYNNAIIIDSYELFREELVGNSYFRDYIRLNDYFGLDGFSELIDKLMAESMEYANIEQERADRGSE